MSFIYTFHNDSLGFLSATAISQNTKTFIKLIPILSVLGYFLLLYTPQTRQVALWLLEENKPIEILTFFVAMAGGFTGLKYALRLKREKARTLVWSFYLIFSAALIFLAMEEISWGQQFLKFPTPSTWLAINQKQETNFHNLYGLHGHSEIMRLIFGFGGIIGVLVSRIPSLRELAASPILMTWFIIIVVHSVVDTYNDYYSIEEGFDFYVQRTSELIELLIVISASLYLILASHERRT